VTGKRKILGEETEAQILDWMKLFRLVSATSKSLTRALKAVRKHSLSFWDAMLWADAVETRVIRLLSEGFQHDRVLEGTRFCNPFALKNPLAHIFDQ
jgi:predicted nucleic acid-binding protein